MERGAKLDILIQIDYIYTQDNANQKLVPAKSYQNKDDNSHKSEAQDI